MMHYLRYLLETITSPIRMLLYTPGRMLEGSRRLSRISLPARVAVLAAIFLLICVVITLVAFAKTQQRPFVQAKLTPAFIVGIVVLVLVIPVVLYKALKLWLEGEVSPYPDIDRAWKAGLAELDAQGLDLRQVPLFLVLGTSTQAQEKALFDAARVGLNVREVPLGPAPLHWYGGPDGVYLVCGGTSCLSRLAAMASENVEPAPVRLPAEPEARPAADKIRGTIMLGTPEAAAALSQTRVPSPAARPAPATPPAPSIYGTMIAGATGAGEDEGAAAPASTERRVLKLEQQEAAEQDRRLEYVCRLTRRVRQPLCPINGILTLLPFGLIQRSAPEAIEVQRAVRKDLGTIQRILMIRCPVTAMVAGLEEEHGFRELVRRVGHERAIHQRFGKGFSVWNPPLAERLEALAAHACGAFEDWVYTLFREKDSLAKPGNSRLFALLCKIRRSVQSRLAKILTSGYACDVDPQPQGESLLFSGCYFAAVGESEDRQAFVKAVVDKLLEQQEELQWTDQALKEDDKQQLLAQLALVFDTLLLVGLVGACVYLWWK